MAKLSKINKDNFTHWIPTFLPSKKNYRKKNEFNSFNFYFPIQLF